MPKLFQNLFSSLTFCIIALSVFCKIPTDPAEDINALKASISIENVTAGIFQDKPVTFKIIINYPKHTRNITVKFDTDIRDTTFKSSRPESVVDETFRVTCIYKTTGKRKLTVEIERTDGTIARFFSEELTVNVRQPTVEFTARASKRISYVNEADTLLFVAKTNIPDGEITFTSTSIPVLTSEHLKVVSSGDTAKIIVLPQEQTSYTIHCYAKIASAVDTADVGLTTITKPVISSISGLAELITGSIDTILIVKPAGSIVAFTFSLLNLQNYDTSIVKLLSSTQDTLKVMFRPVEAKTHTISILVKKDDLSDTITFQRVVTGAPVSAWQQPSATTNATEGKQLSHAFSAYLTDASRTDITFRSSKGTIENNSIKYSVPWGSNQKDSIVIFATANEIESQFTLYFNVTSSDSSSPKLTLVAPATTTFKTNDTKITCKITAVDSGAGTGSVIFTMDGTVISDTTRTDSLYLCNITNLVHGVPVTVKILVTDASMRKNRDSITLTITRDSTMEDKNPPTISIVADPRVNGRVTVDTGTVKVLIDDRSGVAENGIIAKLNGTAIAGLTKTGSIYSVPYKLTLYGLNVISIKVIDNSQAKNSDSLIINLDYNTKVAPVNAVSPKNDSAKVPLQPAFTWNGGTDADHDTVFYKVIYGTDSLTLNNQTSVVTQSSVTLAATLTSNTKYFWKVIGYTKKYPDTVSSSVLRFTTLNNDNSGPTITFKSGTADGSRVKTASGEIVVTVTDPNGIQGVSATLNGTLLTGLTSSGADYTIPYTLTTFGNNTIIITGKDDSPDHNGNTMTITFTYNTSPAPLALVGPADNAQEIDTLPTIKWTGGSDADGDTVLLKVRYGTSATALTSQTPEYANVNEIKFSTKLTANTTYYWSVIGNSKKIRSDSVVLGPYSFKTVNPDRKNPIIRITSPSPYTTGMRVTTATNTISLTAIDENGIDSVYYTVNAGITKTMIPDNNGTYTFSYTLLRRGLDTITIAAIDLSDQHNKTTTQVIVNYNTPLPSTITMGTPANNATEIAVLASFTWTAVSDADNDTVYYVVEYSTEANFTGASYSKEISTNSVTLTAGNELDYNTNYHYRVVGYTKNYPDTARSSSRSFTTFNRVPTVTLITPANNSTNINPATASVSFTGSDPDGNTLTYSVAVSTSPTNVMSSTMNTENITTSTFSLSSFALSYATHYYWQVIAVDNGIAPKRDTSDVFSFYTLNRAPIWTTFTADDTACYRPKIDLSKVCSDPDGTRLTFEVVSPSTATINGTILTYYADGKDITINATDEGNASARFTFSRNYIYPKLMKLINAGTFTMGSNDSIQVTDEGGYWSKDAMPAHQVTLTKNFWIDSTEVTQADYMDLMQVNPSVAVADNNPVNQVTWYDAILYCNERSKRHGLDTVYSYSSISGIMGNGCTLGSVKYRLSNNGYRLPTEAEWEFACRAGTFSIYYWGNALASEYAYIYLGYYNNIKPVASLKSNNWHLYDMIGNVTEWCNDWFDQYPSNAVAETDPVGGSGIQRVVRGGFVSNSPDEIAVGNSAYRLKKDPASKKEDLVGLTGFRCVRNK